MNEQPCPYSPETGHHMFRASLRTGKYVCRRCGFPAYDELASNCRSHFQQQERTSEETMPTTMNRDHPRWGEFIERLAGRCDIQEDGFARNCLGGRDKSKAIAIMESMGDIDIPASLAFFVRRAGFCDCEILFNVADYDANR